MIEVRSQGDLSKISDKTSHGRAQSPICGQMLCSARGKSRLQSARAKGEGVLDKAHLQLRGMPIVITLLTLLMIVFLTYSSEAFAQGINDTRFVKRVASNVNAYWGREFWLLGDSYTPAKLVLINNKQRVRTVCGLFSTMDGPAYCTDNLTLYYPIRWLDNGRTLASYGKSAVEWAVAHEIGHHVQVQLDDAGIQRLDNLPLNLIELQADCFSGMYASQAITQPKGIKAVIAAMKGTGDPTHGSSQQRLAAYELGYQSSDLSQCLALGSGGITSGSNISGATPRRNYHHGNFGNSRAG